jgi:hypothetical protein
MTSLPPPSVNPGTWLLLGVSEDEREAKAEWLSRDHPRFPGSLVLYFRTAAKLLRLSHDDLTLLPWVFAQTVIGLEKVLRIHYQACKDQSLGQLLQKAITDGLFADSAFECIWPLPKEFLKRFEGKVPEAHAAKLAVLIPSLRNDLLHGDLQGYYFDDLLPLTIQIREIVDALVQHLPKSRLEAMTA